MRGVNNVIIGILVSISLLFIFNIYYLKGLFNAFEMETRQLVLSCIEKADNRELLIRLQEISKDSSDRRSIAISKTFSNDSIATTVFETAVSDLEEKPHLPAQAHSEALDFNILPFEQLVKEISLTVHQKIDSAFPIRLNRLDSLLNIELKTAGILSRVRSSEIMQVNPRERTQQVQSDKTTHKARQGETSLFTYNVGSNYVYKVYLDSLTVVVLKRMYGLVISTLLLIILLGIAFGYLIRTIMQQRTIEEMKDDFTNNMTHELKTPIAVAYSAADTLLNFRQGDKKEKRIEYLQICLDQLSQLSALVEQILSMSMERRKSVQLNKEPVAINDFIRQLMALHQLKSTKPVTFTMQVHPEDMTLYVDRVHFNNIVSNLIDNAIKFSSEKVVIEIAAYQEAAFHVLVIRDYGLGIDSNHIKRIFEKFYRVPNGNLHTCKGYGLGLFYVKQLVERHGGCISVRSKLNKGTVFTLKIPVR